jgi:hypothetical protein
MLLTEANGGASSMLCCNDHRHPVHIKKQGLDICLSHGNGVYDMPPGWYQRMVA